MASATAGRGSSYGILGRAATRRGRGRQVGGGRFELPTSCYQNKHSNLTELHPDTVTIASASGGRQPDTLCAAPINSLTGDSIVVRLPSQAVRGTLRVSNQAGNATSADEFLPILAVTVFRVR